MATVLEIKDDLHTSTSRPRDRCNSVVVLPHMCNATYILFYRQNIKSPFTMCYFYLVMIIIIVTFFSFFFFLLQVSRDACFKM